MTFSPVHPRDLAFANSTRIVDNKTFMQYSANKNIHTIHIHIVLHTRVEVE